MTETNSNDSHLGSTFLLVVIGQTISSLGNALTIFAIQWEVWTRLESGTALALLWILVALPYILIGPIAGPFIDRWPRRWLLIITEVISALLVGGTIVVILATDFSLALIYVLVLSLTTVRVFRTPAIQASIPLLVAKKQLARANSLFELGLNSSQILGAAVGGVLIAAGLDLIDFFVIDIGSYLLTTLLLIFVRIPQAQVQRKQEEETAESQEQKLLTDLLDGVRFLWSQRVLFWLMGVAMIVNLLGSGLNVLLPQIVTEKFQAGSELFGIIGSALSIGSLIGGGILLIWGGPRQKVAGFLWALLIASIFQMGAGLVSMGWLVAVTLGSAVAAWMIADTLGTTVFQEMTPLHMQGRVFALRRSLEQFTWPISLLLTGLLVPSVMRADLFLIVAGGISLTVVVVVLWLSRATWRGKAIYLETGD